MGYGSRRGAGRGTRTVSAMLPLDAARWAELSHAFGTAEDIPRLLAALRTLGEERERAELWFGVWATLAPDDRVVTAAYAALPHLLAIADERGHREQLSALHVAATIEINRHDEGAPRVPDDLVEAYAAAIESLPRRVAALVDEPWDATAAQVLSAALLAGKRQPALAREILALGRA